ncbi:hypothetical protein BH09PLA1_BH09PLA1_17080 [soil metagenome]
MMNRVNRFALVITLLAMSNGASAALGGFTNNILVTGYWPPTNEMVRRFSNSPTQNPSGWIGGNWEGRGYNIYSFFPEFPGGTAVNPKGNGDLEVDYQDTSEDWWRITNEIKPVAIITFSRGSAGANWEIEARTKNRTAWVSDYVVPLKPTPAPPDSSVPAETIRFSTLPMTQIRDNVNAASLGFSSFIDSTSSSLAGGFLSEYIGYHGMWYQSIHASPDDPYQTFAAGHIHVGIDTPLDGAMAATDISLRTLIEQLNATVPEPAIAALSLCFISMLRRRRTV